MILLVDHDDSFVHILAGYLRRLGAETSVRRASELTLDEIRASPPAGLLLSPGPRRPEDCPLALELVTVLGDRVPTLGVCLGHQVIVTACGGVVAPVQPRHGMTSPVSHDGSRIFADIPSPFDATRYHSLAALPDSLPDNLKVTARADDDGVIMAVEHRTLPIWGVQFHPESILTEHGITLLSNWLEMVGPRNGANR